MLVANWGGPYIAPGSNTAVWTSSYTPVSASSDLHCLLGGFKTIINGSGNDGYYTIQAFISTSHVGNAWLTYNGAGARMENTLDYPMMMKYVNTSTTAKSIVIRGVVDSNANTDDGMTLIGGATTYLQITEVAR
jgi:hypothetical protein